MMELFNSEVVSAEAMRLVLITGIVVYGATTLIINFANIKLLEKGVNVA